MKDFLQQLLLFKQLHSGARRSRVDLVADFGFKIAIYSYSMKEVWLQTAQEVENDWEKTTKKFQLMLGLSFSLQVRSKVKMVPMNLRSMNKYKKVHGSAPGRKCFLCRREHHPKDCGIRNKMVEELKTLPSKNRKQYCLVHRENTDYNSLQCF